MAMWAGIATSEQAKRMVEEQLRNPTTPGSAFGIRSLSKLEKKHALHAGDNPFEWDGPILGISNYMVFRGLAKDGFQQEARQSADETIELFGRDLEKEGTLHEYCSPDTGEPIIDNGFQSWNYLVIGMIAREENRASVEEW